MEAIIGKLSTEEFFGLGTNNSGNPNLGLRNNSDVIVYSIVGILISGVIVYIFRYDIEAFLNSLTGRSSDEN